MMLMEAPSKDLIQQIFTHVYMHRNDMTQTNPQKFAEKFQKPERVTAEHVKQVYNILRGTSLHTLVYLSISQLFAAICDLIASALYENVSGVAQVGNKNHG